MSTFDGRVI